jgi:hypothetical protein
MNDPFSIEAGPFRSTIAAALGELLIPFTMA